MMQEEDYRSFTIDDFVWDEQFRKWVLTSDPELNIFWANWLVENPGKAQLAAAAREIVLSLKVQEIPVSDQEIQAVIKSTLNEISIRKAGNINNHKRILKIQPLRLTAAAVAVLLVSFACWFWLNRNMTGVQKQVQTPVSVGYTDLVKLSNDRLTERVNKSDKPLTVKLEDGSKIVLEKNARISFAASFISTQQREVYLSGEASFKIAKDPAKPFFVYANGLVTKVLGTEFRVRTYEAEDKVTVEVTSGVVSVFSFADKKSKDEWRNKKLVSLVLTRNQKAVYSGKDNSLIASVIEKPVLQKNLPIDYRFVNTPVDSVFRAIKRGYGIDIIYDENAFSNRTLTANLTNASMYQKLNIICKATNSHYEAMDGKIIIYSSFY